MLIGQELQQTLESAQLAPMLQYHFQSLRKQ